MIYLNNRKINEAKIGLKDKHDWEAIGYPNEPQFISDGYDYALEMQKHWNVNKQSDMLRFFESNEKIVFIPKLDLSNVERVDYLFFNCSSLSYMGELDFKSQNIQGIKLFYDCPKLKEINIKNTENSNLVLFNDKCVSLKKVYPFSVKNSNRFINFTNFSLQEMEMIDLGAKSDLKQVTMNLPNWGLNSIEYPNAKQSVINTFKNAYDRTTNGLSNVDLMLEPSILTRLPVEIKKELSNKGYTFNRKNYNELNPDMEIHYTQDITNDNFNYTLNISDGVNREYEYFIKENEVNENIDAFAPSRMGKIKLPAKITNLYKLPKLNYNNFSDMFGNCVYIQNIDLSQINANLVQSTDNMFRGCSLLKEITLPKLNTASITNYFNMFYRNSQLTKITMIEATLEDVEWIKARLVESRIPEGQVTIVTDITPTTDKPLTIISNATPYSFTLNSNTSDPKTIKVTESPFTRSLSQLSINKAISYDTSFGKNSNVVEIILPTSNSTNFENTFAGASNLQKANLSNVDIQACTNFNYMFQNCGSLTEINLDNWKFNGKVTTNLMFIGCRSLKTIYLRNSDETSKLIIDNALKEDGLTSQVTVITE